MDWIPAFAGMSAPLRELPSPLGRGCPTTALSPAVAGRVRGQFRATREGFPHSADEFFRVVHHQPIGNSQQAYADTSQKIFFRRVFQHLTCLRVNTSVKLDRQATFEAAEIDNPDFQAAPAAEFCAQLSAAQQIPCRPFGVSLAAAQLADVFG